MNRLPISNGARPSCSIGPASRAITNRSGRRGFTLIEVMLCLGLITVLIASMTAFLFEIADSRRTIMHAARDLEAAETVIERLEHDLLTGLAGGPGMGAGIRGSSTSLTVLTRGIDLPIGASIDPGDLQGSEFSFQLAGNSTRLTATRLTSVTTGAASGAAETISDRFERVRFRYFDGKTWRNDFDSLKEQKLPVAIEVSIWITSIGNERAPAREMPVVAVATSAAGSSATAGDESAATEDAAARPTASRSNSVFVWGPPNRRRVIIVPDGPEADWSAAP